MKVRPQDAGKWSFRFGYPSLQKWKLGLLVVKNASWVTFIKIIAQLDRRKILPQFSPKNAENENGQQKNRNKKKHGKHVHANFWALEKKTTENDFMVGKTEGLCYLEFPDNYHWVSQTGNLQRHPCAMRRFDWASGKMGALRFFLKGRQTFFCGKNKWSLDHHFQNWNLFSFEKKQRLVRCSKLLVTVKKH